MSERVRNEMRWFVAVAVGPQTYDEQRRRSVWAQDGEHRCWLVRARTTGEARDLTAERVRRDLVEGVPSDGVRCYLIDCSVAVEVPRAHTSKVYTPAARLPSTESCIPFRVVPYGHVGSDV